MDIEVEKLRGSDKPDLVELFTQAFREHPLIPALGARPEMARQGMDAFLSCFGGAESAVAYGIRRDGKLISASLCLDAGEEPPRPALLQLVLFLAQVAGGGVVKELEVIAKEEPKYQDHYLEVLMLGTLPAYQKQGLGRRVLRFLYDEAKRLDYKGLTLLADCNTPAYQLYLKEGFIVDKEFTVGEATLCWMRFTF